MQGLKYTISALTDRALAKCFGNLEYCEPIQAVHTLRLMAQQPVTLLL